MGAVLVLEGGLILFMLATPFWVMILARFVMGAASTVVWSGRLMPRTTRSGLIWDYIVGFALM